MKAPEVQAFPELWAHVGFKKLRIVYVEDRMEEFNNLYGKWLCSFDTRRGMRASGAWIFLGEISGEGEV